MGMIQDGGGAGRPKLFPAGLNVAAKPCDYCKSVAALLFCRAESAFLCISCDVKVHNASDNVACLKHERVWMCEVCEQAPAAVTCKADAAALCITCDRDIHSANPLASRHERVPVVPFFDKAESVVMKSTAASTLLVPVSDCNTNIFTAPPSDYEGKFETQNGYISDSWISTSPVVTTKVATDIPDIKSMELFFQNSDQFLDFENYQISSQPYSDSVVPVQTPNKPPVPARLTHDHTSENRFEIDFIRSNINSYNNSYTTPSLSHSVSSSSMDVGVVPDGSSFSDASYPFPFARNINSTGDLTGNQNSQVVGMDREARVLRYKEKRKNRKFEKTIRYASRKAYAETRPRIKGRFAKRTDTEPDIHRVFGAGSTNLIAHSRFGIVPSF